MREDRSPNPALVPVLLVLSLISGAPAAAAPSPRVVGSSLTVLKVWAIDSANESFSADFLLQFTWSDSGLRTGPHGEEPDWSRVWTPHIEAVNSRDMEKQSEDYFSLVAPGKGYSYNRYHGSFDAPMDLRRFPFDTQTLSIQLESSDDDRTALVFGYQPSFSAPVVDLRRGPTTADLEASLGESARLPDWTVKEVRVVEQPRLYPMLEETYSHLEFQIVARRTWSYFAWKVLAIIFLNVVLSWAVFFISPQELGTRLGISITLFLAAVAFSIVVQSLTPRVSYLTLLDYYVLASYAMILLSCAESVAARYARPSATAGPGFDAGAALDRRARVLFPVVYFMLHAVIAGVASRP